jgi:starch synthase
VIFPGFAERRNLPDYYQRATLYVSATWYESFGYTILEAMACGTAVVATRVGGVPELVEEGVTGLLVPPRNENALAEAIIELLDDPARRQKMGAQGRERAVENFAVEKVMAQTLEFYERAMTT